MSLLIPFANQLQPPKADQTASGQFHSVVPINFATAFVSSVANPTNTLLLVGDNTSGTIAWTEKTTPANNQTVDDTPIFNSNGDKYFVALAEGDIIESLDWYVSTPGVYSGTVTATIRHKLANGTIEVDGPINMPDMTTVGIKRLVFTHVNDVNELGYLDDPRGLTFAATKSIEIEFNGITSMTTAPLASHCWKRRTATAPKVTTNYTDLATNPDKTPYAAAQVLPLHGDITVMGANEKFSSIFAEILRARESSWVTDIIYSKGNDTYGTVPVGDLNITSGAGGNDEMWTSGTGFFVDSFIPPADWAKNTVTDNLGTNTMYWLGWQYTADAASPALVLTGNIKIGRITGNTVSGVLADEAKTYSKMEFFCRTAPASSTWVLITNKTTEQTASVKLNANSTYQSNTINLTVAVGDEVVIQVIKGDALFNAADGFIRLS